MNHCCIFDPVLVNKTTVLRLIHSQEWVGKNSNNNNHRILRGESLSYQATFRMPTDKYIHDLQTNTDTDKTN